MEKKIVLGEDAKYYNYVERLWDSVASLYNYNYLKTNDSFEDTIYFLEKENISKNKYYFVAGNYLGLFNLNDSFMALVEVISLAYRLLEEMGMQDGLVDIDIKDDKIFNYLELLDVDYEIGQVSEYKEFKTTIFEIINDKEVLVYGGELKNGYGFIIDLEKIVKILKDIGDKRLLNNTLDVNILANSIEEQMVGMRLVQDLRWSDIKSDIGEFDSRLTVILDQEALNKGLMQVKDNLTGDIKDVDENEILEYLISNL